MQKAFDSFSWAVLPATPSENSFVSISSQKLGPKLADIIIHVNISFRKEKTAIKK